MDRGRELSSVWPPHETDSCLCSHSRAPGGEIFCRQASLTAPVRPHRHDTHVIAFVLGGSGQHEDRDGRFPIFAGDVCVVPPGEWHGYPRVHAILSLFYLAVSRSCLVACAPLLGTVPWLRLQPSGDPTQEVNGHHVTHLRLSPFDLSRLHPLLLALSDELEGASGSENRALRAGLLLQIIGLLDHSSRPDEQAPEMPSVPAGTPSDDHGIARAVRYLEERYMVPLSIKELASQSGYTPTSLTRRFRQQFGMSPSEYLLNLRVQKACCLLRDTELSIGSIARHVGFRDGQYFATRFHHAFGVTPSDFRAKAKTKSRTA